MPTPLDRKLARAPLDDEPVTLAESAAIEAGIAPWNVTVAYR